MQHRLLVYIEKSLYYGLRFLLLLFLVRGFGIEPAFVSGQSMEKNFYDGERFVIQKYAYLFKKPQRGDIVVALHGKDSSVIKRVIGLPGETVNVEGGGVSIELQDGSSFILHEPYLEANKPTLMPYGAETRFTLKAHEYFLLGDNRLHSTDSRHYGAVHRASILGKVKTKEAKTLSEENLVLHP